MPDILHPARAWSHCQEALAVETSRVTELLRSLPGSGGPGSDGPGSGGPGSGGRGCVGRWSADEVAVHLSQTWIAIPGLARGDLTEVESIVPDRGAGASVARDVSQLGAVTLAAVAAEPVRDPALLADRIAARATDYLRDCADGTDPDEHRSWLLSGITVPPHVFTAHLLSETLVHGQDIAHASGRRWPIDPEHAALVVRWFLLELLVYGAPQMFGDPATLARVSGRYRFDIRRYGSVRLVFDAAGARLDTDPGPPDCRMSLHPVAFLLLFFGRRSLGSTALRGGVLVGGRKPWLGLRLQQSVPTP